MVRWHKTLKRSTNEAQTFIEYTLLFGILIALLAIMTPLMKRGIQGMVKGVADQVGLQQNAEQEGGRGGYLVNYVADSSMNQIKNVRERLGDITYNYIIDETESQSETFSIVGFQEKE